MLNAVDAKAIAPAVERAHKAGIVVAAFDVGAQGADVTVMTDNVKAGTLACQYIVDHLSGGKGDVLIVNGPQVTSVVDRVKGCKEVFAKTPASRSCRRIRTPRVRETAAWPSPRAF